MWFSTESISILGEYGNSLGARVERRRMVDGDETLLDFFYQTSAKLGIAAYF